jgi:hypothetical protein
MQQLSTLNTIEPIDYENLNIIRSQPPGRCQSGISLVPFLPYVKCLTSIREPISFADDHDQRMTMGKNSTFLNNLISSQIKIELNILARRSYRPLDLRILLFRYFAAMYQTNHLKRTVF